MSTLAELKLKVKAQAQVIAEQEHTINAQRAELISLRAKAIARQRKKQNGASRGR
jgi:hypothetical protein